MTAYLAIVRWEVMTALRRISTWVYFLIFLALSFFFMLAAGGAWDEINVAIGSGGKVLANAPFALASLMPALGLLGVSITAALAGQALYKDYEVHAESLFYTTPVSKAAFLGGRYTGMLIVNALVVLGLGVGAFAATVSPWVHADKIAPFHLMAYVKPYATLLLPNIVLTGAIFFSLVAITRQMLPNYVGGAVLLIGYLLAASAAAGISDPQSKQWVALLDPFGSRAQAFLTQYWSIADKNARLVPFTGVLVVNRVVWFAVAAGVFAIGYVRFRFAYAASENTGPTVAPPLPVDQGAADVVLVAPVRTTALPRTTRRFGGAAAIAQFWSVFVRSFRRIVRSRYFAILAGVGLLYLIVVSRAVGNLYGTPTWPETLQTEEVLSGTFGVFIVVLIALYAGELVWDERDAHIHQIYDATPAATGVSLLAKFAALVGMIVTLLFTMMLAGIASQIVRGYYRFEIPLYLEALFGFRLVDYVLIAALAMTVHVVLNQKYLGHLVVVLLYLAMGLLATLGLEHNLYHYGSDSGSAYSDMNRWGPYVWPYVWWKLYWGSFAALLLVACAAFWVRGEETTLAARLRIARDRLRGRLRATAVLAGAAFVGLGAFLYYNTTVLNIYRSSKATRHLRAEYEKRYKRFEHVPQPRITAVTVAVDLQPSAQSAVVHGSYVLRNRAAAPIDSIHLGLDEEIEIRALAFDRPSRQVLSDRPHEYLIYTLAPPLAPGDSAVLTFTIARVVRGFPNEIQNPPIAGNGTFLENTAFMPHIGYVRSNELSDDDTRRKEGLGPRPRMRPPTDPATWQRSYISADADWLRYDATVSTDPDQLGITSGYLERTWVAGGRRYFHYTMDAPIVNLWAVQSARYATKRGAWRGANGQQVDIEVHYHLAHAYNVDRMISSVRKALDYYTTNFSPYQFHQVRIVEFPRYATFAQSLPNTIPYSEAVGFIARLKKPTDIDYPFYITAHEIAHQWWAHQLVGADAQGSTMLSETMAQYSALMVVEKEFGPANMRRFLEYELNSYLVGRSTERQREMPLELGENQPYIHYQKGSLVMYALRDYIGEERMNRAIRGFLTAHQFRGPPYPTSLQLVDALRAATPDSLKYLITDLFEQITLYELKADSVVANDAPAGAPGKYQVDLYATAKKLRADSVGKETEQPMHDWIDVGVFAKPAKGDTTVDPGVGVPLHLAKHQVTSGVQKITVFVDQKPYRAGIDPLHKLVDRITTDNTVGVRDRSKPTAPVRPVK